MFAYLAFEKFSNELATELKNNRAISDRLFVSDTLQNCIWAQCIWHDCEILTVESVGDAAKALKARGKWWALYSFDHHRRAQLIQDQLPKYKIPPMKFLGKVPDQPMGAWTMLEKNQILVAAKTSSPFPLGEIRFVEDKETPPSRAYLKLWEALTVQKTLPKKGGALYGPWQLSWGMDLGSATGRCPRHQRR